MPRVVITHDVVDLQRWLAGKGERAEVISAIGSNVVDTVALDGSNKIALIAEIDDLAALQAMLDSPPPEISRPDGETRSPTSLYGIRGKMSRPV